MSRERASWASSRSSARTARNIKGVPAKIKNSCSDNTAERVWAEEGATSMNCSPNGQKRNDYHGAADSRCAKSQCRPQQEWHERIEYRRGSWPPRNQKDYTT